MGVEISKFEPDAPILDQDTGKPLDNEAGILTFESDAMQVKSGESNIEYVIRVHRKNGALGRVTCKYRFESLTATPGYDYQDTPGEITFKYDGTLAEIPITISSKGRGELDDRFQIILEEPSGDLLLNPYGDGGPECCTLTVTIINTTPSDPKSFVEKTIRALDRAVNIKDIKLGNSTWWEQIVGAIYVGGSKEEQDQAGFTDWVAHIIWFPWSFLFSVFTPPPIYAGGWVCFWFSLAHIGWITVLVGDLAELFGCVAEIDDEITAITFVALGTSVPDLFASRTAAKQDEWADASIVNVTGSNSVNVFLGIGLPWMAASIFWHFNGPNEEWNRRYGSSDYPSGSFVVASGNLSFSVAVFTLAALAALIVIQVRRHLFGGELGGDADPKAYSSFFFFLLWIFYIALSVWKYGNQSVSLIGQAVAVLIVIPIIMVLMVCFALCRQALIISKEFIGEEGFWGLFIAGLIIFGRMGVFFGFQYQW